MKQALSLYVQLYIIILILHFFLASAEDKVDQAPKKGESQHTTVQMSSETNHGRHQRPSLIEFLTGGDHSGTRPHSGGHHNEHDPQNPQQRGKGLGISDLAQ